MGKKILNQKTMQDYFNGFDALRHKFLYALKENKNIDLQVLDKLMETFYPRRRSDWDMDHAVETFLTMDKVYHYGSDRDAENTNILEQVTEKFLRQYVNIEGMEGLFQSSYFYFEWMMHLEYQEQQHDYSYYRDHYLHQVRNLYEMFMLLDQDGLWATCIDIYQRKNNRVAVEMKNSVREQKERMTSQMLQCVNELDRQFLIRDFGTWKFEECCYHYIIFATAIVASLVHDIGYPIVYMKRNMKRMQGFLPMSHIFMDMGNGMPHVRSLLSDSLLFATVEGEEIQERLEKNDHGAYSAVILLYQYYDNGRIFKLDPVKRMVVELSALVIYNHTLKYAFQDKKKHDRYHSVFTDNPISYLFRLCDDLQEWERVYFLISDKSAFFVCDQCKTPMIRSENKRHVSDGRQSYKSFSYSCMCGAKGWNSLWFPYRRMINVAPFEELEISCVEKAKNEEKERWVFELKCDRKALLQLAHYNDTFALQRMRGVRELRAMVKTQEKLPEIFVKAFLTNNPLAVKAKILEEFLTAENMSGLFSDFVFCKDNFKYSYSSKKFSVNLRTGLEKIKSRIGKECCSDKIYRKLEEEISLNCEEWIQKEEGRNKEKFGSTCTEKLMKESLEFYLYLARLGHIACRKELKFSAKTRKDYEEELSRYCDCLAEETASVWNILDSNTIDLIADCFLLMHCDFSSEESFYCEDGYRYQVMYPQRQDICDLVQSYVDEQNYLDMCKSKERKGKLGENIFDFYSDYYLYFVMDVCTERKGG